LKNKKCDIMQTVFLSKKTKNFRMYKNKHFIIVFFIFFFSVGAFLFVSDASAAGLQYTLLEKIPGLGNTNGSDLPGYILAVYNVALAVVVLSAVLMVSVGGFMYLTSAGNTSAMGTAKGVIFDALIGLALALSAWVLLNTINPDLTTVSINGLSATSVPGQPTPVPTPGAPAPAGGTYTHAEAVAALGEIHVKSSGRCSDQNNKTCTSLDGIPKSTITNIVNLKSVSHCSDFNVTGGTEVGHTSHGTGLPVVDVTNSSCLKTFLSNKSNLPNVHITKICAIASEQSVAYNCTYKETRPHFHLVFSL